MEDQEYGESSLSVSYYTSFTRLYSDMSWMRTVFPFLVWLETRFTGSIISMRSYKAGSPIIMSKKDLSAIRKFRGTISSSNVTVTAVSSLKQRNGPICDGDVLVGILFYDRKEVCELLGEDFGHGSRFEHRVHFVPVDHDFGNF